MNILVLVKAVSGNTRGYTKAERDCSELIPNPADLTALEEALKLKDRDNSAVTVLSMGPRSVEPILRDTLSRGADRAVLLCDNAFAGADTAATSKTIAAAIRILGPFELVLCGRKTTDGETGQVGPELAVRDGRALVPCACSLSVDGSSICAHCLDDGGVFEYRSPFPALVSVVYGMNSPRLPSLSGIRKANRTPVELLGLGDLGLQPSDCGQEGSPTRVLSSSAGTFKKRNAEFVTSCEALPVIDRTRKGCVSHV